MAARLSGNPQEPQLLWSSLGSALSPWVCAGPEVCFWPITYGKGGKTSCSRICYVTWDSTSQQPCSRTSLAPWVALKKQLLWLYSHKNGWLLPATWVSLKLDPSPAGGNGESPALATALSASFQRIQWAVVRLRTHRWDHHYVLHEASTVVIFAAHHRKY